MWQPGLKPLAAAVDTPQHLVDALSPRKTHIVSLELMAAAERLYTYDICGLRSSLPLCAPKAVLTETDYGLGKEYVPRSQEPLPQSWADTMEESDGRINPEWQRHCSHRLFSYITLL